MAKERKQITAYHSFLFAFFSLSLVYLPLLYPWRLSLIPRRCLHGNPIEIPFNLALRTLWRFSSVLSLREMGQTPSGWCNFSHSFSATTFGFVAVTCLFLCFIMYFPLSLSLFVCLFDPLLLDIRPCLAYSLFHSFILYPFPSLPHPPFPSLPPFLLPSCPSSLPLSMYPPSTLPPSLLPPFERTPPKPCLPHGRNSRVFLASLSSCPTYANTITTSHHTITTSRHHNTITTSRHHNTITT